MIRTARLPLICGRGADWTLIRNYAPVRLFNQDTPIGGHIRPRIRFLLVVNIFKLVIPIAAMFCIGAFAPFAEAGSKKSSDSKRTSSASARKKSSSSKKSASKSSRSSKSKSQRSAKSKKKKKSDQRTAKAETSHSWIDDLPAVELPEASGPAEDELLEPVAEAELEPDAEPEPEPQP